MKAAGIVDTILIKMFHMEHKQIFITLDLAILLKKKLAEENIES